jgi:transposase InsO family protein
MSQLAAPLYALTKADSKLVWTVDHESSFVRLKAALTHAPVLSFPDIRGGNFILDTDASNTGIGSVLSQVQDGRETVIGYYSKLLSDSERKYCITKREFLGVVKAVQHFKPYLYGQNFLIRTDNSAVSHMLTLTDANEQIQRWQLFMSQFKFHTIHRPGRQHINADFMSRLRCDQCGRAEAPDKNLPKGKPRKFRLKESTDVPPCVHTKTTDESVENSVDGLMWDCKAVTTRAQTRLNYQEPTPQIVPDINDEQPGKFLIADIANLQNCDPDIAPIFQLKLTSPEYPSYRSISAESLNVKALRQHWRNLIVENGILYRRLEVPNKPTRIQLVLPRTLREETMEKLHSAPSSGHLGTHKTLERIKARFYWVGWRRDVLRFVSHCETCNIIKRPHKKQHVPLTQQLFGEAFERVSIDIIGPLRETPRGFRYALTMEDNFTKWVEAAPLKTLETEEICNAIIRDLVSRYGCMYIIHSDRGAQFVSKLYGSLLQKLGIDRSLTTPYNPKSNGLVENFNKILKSMLKTYVHDHKESVGEWDTMLPIFLMAYRSSIHSSTGETPHFMVTAREMKIPLDLLYSAPADSMQSVPGYIRQLESRFHKAYSIVRNHLQVAQRIQKKQYEVSSPKYQSLKEGDFVWYFNPRKTFKGDKHQPWKGPYLVKDVREDFTVTIQDAVGVTSRTHADKLRLARGMTLEKWHQKG